MPQTDFFDPVAEVKNRLDTSGFSDAQIYQNLSDPAKFRQAFPEYSHLDDATITRNMQQLGTKMPGYVASSSSVPPIIARAAMPAGAPSSVQMDTDTLGQTYDAAKQIKEADIDPLEQAAIGFGKSLLHTAGETGALITDPLVRRLAPQAAQMSDKKIQRLTEPQGTAQKVGSIAGDIAPYLVPGVGEEEAATLLPKAPLVGKMLYNSATTGAISAGESGNAKDAISGGAIGMLSPFIGKYVSEPLAKYLGEKAPANVINRLIGVGRKELQYGSNPGLAIANEGITAGSIEALQQKVEQRISALNDQLESTFRAKGVQALDTSHAVIDPIDREIANAMSGRVANKTYLNALVDLRDSITHELTAEGGRGNPKNLVMSPSDVLDFKRSIGKITRWTPENSSVYGELNGLKREIYHNLDSMLDQVAPGTESLNSRMSNLISASEAVDRKIPVVARSASALTRVGAPLVSAAAGATYGHPVEGALAGIGVNVAKDAIASTPGSTLRAQALQTASPLVQPAARVATAGTAVATQDRPKTLGQQAADYIGNKFPNYFSGRRK